MISAIAIAILSVIIIAIWIAVLCMMRDDGTPLDPRVSAQDEDTQPYTIDER